MAIEEREGWLNCLACFYQFPAIGMASPSMGGSKRRLSSRGLGGALREQRARLYIIRRCVVMLLCWHD
ncbi:hypothetical protein VNO80_16256 [Phaseolus coccineus]|uniref:DEVIL-like protein n=1 Tax=Phaseolus coccineus TaxID=3886 RepID=A0AAN9QZY1_PHACN